MNEHEKIMTSVLKAVEEQLTKLKIDELTPKVILGTGQTLDSFFEFVCKEKADWREEVYMCFQDLKEGEEPTEIIRCMRTLDLKYGEIIVL